VVFPATTPVSTFFKNVFLGRAAHVQRLRKSAHQPQAKETKVCCRRALQRLVGVRFSESQPRTPQAAVLLLPLPADANPGIRLYGLPFLQQGRGSNVDTVRFVRPKNTILATLRCTSSLVIAEYFFAAIKPIFCSPPKNTPSPDSYSSPVDRALFL